MIHPLASGLHFKWERSPHGKHDDKYAEFTTICPADKDMKDFDWETQGGMPPFSQLRVLRVPEVHIRVVGGARIPSDCEWLIDGNYTDYIALPDTYETNRAINAAFAWSTKILGGFTKEHIEILREHMPTLCTVVRLLADDRVAKTLLVTYLGEGPGSRVHSGSNHRGMETGHGLSFGFQTQETLLQCPIACPDVLLFRSLTQSSRSRSL